MLSRPVNITTSAGVYLIKHREVPIYIGKAKNLKKRLVSYWRKNASNKVKSLLTEANELELFETQSEIEALIKEAELIKKHLPKYNVLLRDDKNYFYVAITKEIFPKIFITHQPTFPSHSEEARRPKNPCLAGGQVKRSFANAQDDKIVEFIGPFTSGFALKTTLKLLRKVFPYCTCKSPHKRPCLNAQIGRCLGFCCTFSVRHPEPLNSHSERSEESHEMLRSAQHDREFFQYQENLKNITTVLTGKKKSLLRSLKKEIQKFSKEQKFEVAGKIRDQIFGIENIFAHRVILRELGDRRISRDPSLSLRMTRVVWSKIEKELQTIFGSLHKISRVEGYDISNISGKEATGSMVVFTNGLPDKNEYRQFKIQTVKQISDVDMLKEVIKRRVRHDDWPNPNLVLIDGGKAQLNAVLSVIENPVPQQGWGTGLRYKNLSNTLFVALAKREEELYFPNRSKTIKIDTLSQQTSLFLKRVRDESHRFARRYHHRLRRKFVFS